MAYDKAKAHQYYIEYRKKGLLKGRKKSDKKSKKSSTKKGKTESLVGVSSSGLNAEGIVEANSIKANMKKEMNEALKGAKTDEEKKAIIADYSKKTASAIEALKKRILSMPRLRAKKPHQARAVVKAVVAVAKAVAVVKAVAVLRVVAQQANPAQDHLMQANPQAQQKQMRLRSGKPKLLMPKVQLRILVK